MINKKTVAATATGLALVVASAIAQSPGANMSFFVTSSNPKGGNLGGLAGADQVCQSLAQSAGAGRRTWHAYLSTTGAGSVDADGTVVGSHHVRVEGPGSLGPCAGTSGAVN